MTITVEFLDPRHDEEPAEYTAYVAEHDLPPLWSYELLGIASWNSWSPSMLAMLSLDGKVVGLICSVWAMPLRNRFAPAHGGPRPRILDVRQPFNGYTPSWHIAPSVPPEDRVRLMTAFERAALRRLGPTCAGIVYRQAHTDDLPMLRSRFRPLRRPALSCMGTALLDGPFADYDAYLKTLTPARRTELRRQMRRTDEATDLDTRFGFGRTDVDTLQAARLLRAHALRLNDGRENRSPPTADFLDRLTRRSDIGILTFSDPGGRLLGYGTLMPIGTDRLIIGAWAALRPEDGGRRHLYFVMYCRFIRWAIENGRTGINGGRGMMEVKKSIGFREEKMHVVIAPRWIS
jgi:hypothetical protein